MASTPFVWVLHVSDALLAGQVFGKVPLVGCEHVADVSERACAVFKRWEVAANQVEFFFVMTAGKPSSSEIDAALLREPLSPFDALTAVGIVSGSSLLARVPPPPAAAPSAHELQASIQSAVSAAVTSSIKSAIASFVESRRSSTSSVAAQPSLGDEQLHGSVSGFDALRERMARLPVPGAVGGGRVPDPAFPPQEPGHAAANEANENPSEGPDAAGGGNGGGSSSSGSRSS